MDAETPLDAARLWAERYGPGVGSEIVNVDSVSGPETVRIALDWSPTDGLTAMEVVDLVPGPAAGAGSSGRSALAESPEARGGGSMELSFSERVLAAARGWRSKGLIHAEVSSVVDHAIASGGRIPRPTGALNSYERALVTLFASEDDLVGSADRLIRPNLGPPTLPPTTYDDSVRFMFELLVERARERAGTASPEAPGSPLSGRAFEPAALLGVIAALVGPNDVRRVFGDARVAELLGPDGSEELSAVVQALVDSAAERP